MRRCGFKRSCRLQRRSSWFERRSCRLETKRHGLDRRSGLNSSLGHRGRTRFERRHKYTFLLGSKGRRSGRRRMDIRRGRHISKGRFGNIGSFWSRGRRLGKRRGVARRRHGRRHDRGHWRCWSDNFLRELGGCPRGSKAATAEAKTLGATGELDWSGRFWLRTNND